MKTRRMARGGLVALVGVALVASAALMSRPVEGQVPIHLDRWGIYDVAWHVDASHVRLGHVIVRGTNAGPIPGVPLAAGQEHWFFREQAVAGSGQGLSLTLTVNANADNSILQTRVQQITSTEQSTGSFPYIANWQGGAPPGDGQQVFRLAQVVNAPPRSYPVDQIAIGLDAAGHPTVWAADGAIETIFGPIGNGFPFQVHIEARFAPTSQGGQGWPGAGWVWTNAHP